jgi:hypothetical protein
LSSTSSSSSSAREDAVRGGHPEQPRLQHERLTAGLARVEPGLLERHAHATPGGVGIVRDVHAGHPGGTRGDREQRREHADHGRLAGAVRPEEAEDLRLHAQVHAADRLDDARPAPVVLDQRLCLYRIAHVASRPNVAAALIGAVIS